MKEVPFEIDEQGLISFTQELIRTPSPSFEEEKVARLVADRMCEVGFDHVTLDELFNVVGYLYGEDRYPELLFNGHIDHIPPSDISDPYSGRIVPGDKYGTPGLVVEGRGACDMKGAVASMIYAGKAIRESGLRLKKTFVITATTREEPAQGEGIRHLFEKSGIRAKMAVSGEATNLQVHLGHRGKLGFTVRIEGKTAHASNPTRGINAIYKACDFIRDLQDGYHLPSHPKLGDCTFTIIDIISGPGGGGIIPDWCEIALDRRYLPGESAESVQREIEAFLARRAEKDENFRGTVKLAKDWPPFYCSEEEQIVSIIRKARERALGAPGQLSVWLFCMEGPVIQKAGIPCAGFGPGHEKFAHTPEDHVPVRDLISSCQVYAEIIRSACCS